MKTIGTYLAIFGLFSIVLNFVGRELVILSWIDTWGMNVGWGIRIGMVVVGAALWFLGRSKEAAEPAPPAP